MAAWKENILPNIVDENELAESKDQAKAPVIAQSSFQFDTPPEIVFVKDLQTQEEALRYKDLPTVPLQPKEQKIHDQTLAQLRTNKNFYNGKQLLLTGAVYDTSNNTLYLEAVRVDYVFLIALEKMKATKTKKSALHHKNFFKTGVLVPFISKDSKVSIITRQDKWSLRSVASGFLECSDESELLSDLVTKTACKEADEEFVLDHFRHRRFDFDGPPTIASISFRDALGMGMTPTIEFVAPIQMKQDADFILSVMNNNEASHAHEHIPGSAMSVPLASGERARGAADFMQQKLPGNFLYGPVLHACAIRENQRNGVLFSPRISEIPNSRFYPIGFFKPVPQSLLDYSTEKNYPSEKDNSFNRITKI
jgi:hypothetical protein